MTNDCIVQARLYHAASDGGLPSAVTGGGRVNGGEGVKGVEGVELLGSRRTPYPLSRRRQERGLFKPCRNGNSGMRNCNHECSPSPAWPQRSRSARSAWPRDLGGRRVVGLKFARRWIANEVPPAASNRCVRRRLLLYRAPPAISLTVGFAEQQDRDDEREAILATAGYRRDSIPKSVDSRKPARGAGGNQVGCVRGSPLATAGPGLADRGL